MNGVALKQLVESEGVGPVCNKLKTLLASGEVKPSDFSIKELWESLVGPCGQTLEFAQRAEGFVQMSEAAVDSTAFADITGQVLTGQVLEAYNMVGYIGDSLFTVRPSRQRTERTPGFVLQDETDEVNEAEPYPESGLRDRYVSFTSGKKRGVLLSITEESIFFDETGVLLDRASGIGEFIRLDRETRMLNVFTGTTNNYYPDGTATTIYHADNSNLTTGNGLVDWTDIDACMQTMAAQTSPEGKKIIVPVNTIVVPWALRATALRIIGATEIRQTSATSGAGSLIQTNGPNLVSSLVGATPRLVSSPLVDGYSGTAWYLGAPKRAFLYREHWPFQSFRRRRETEDGWTKDIVEQFKFREWGTAHCRDHRYNYKNTA
jgi:hypothetical protein